MPKKIQQVFRFVRFDSWRGNFANEQCHKILDVSDLYVIVLWDHEVF